MWRSPSGNLTPAQYQAHVDQFTTAESVSEFVTNVVYPIPAMFGGANMTFENYCKDVLCAADGKPAFGPSINGKAVFFVCHRNIRKAEWDQLMGPLFGAVAAGDGTAAGISKAMGVSLTFLCMIVCVFVSTIVRMFLCCHVSFIFKTGSCRTIRTHVIVFLYL